MGYTLFLCVQNEDHFLDAEIGSAVLPQTRKYPTVPHTVAPWHSFKSSKLSTGKALVIQCAILAVLLANVDAVSSRNKSVSESEAVKVGNVPILYACLPCSRTYLHSHGSYAYDAPSGRVSTYVCPMWAPTITLQIR